MRVLAKTSAALCGAFKFGLAALILGGLAVHAASGTLDTNLNAIVNGIHDNNFDQAYEGLKSASERLAELFKEANEAAEPLKSVAEELSRGLKVFSGDPIELEKLGDMIDKDIAKLDGVKVTEPSFGNPELGVSDASLSNANPIIRGAALDKVIAQGGALRSNYESELATLEVDRNKALSVVDEAKKTLTRGEAVERALEEANNSAAGPWLNIGGGRFAFMWLDMTTSINPKLSSRITAAENLVKRYDKSIAQMKVILGKYELYSKWVRFYRWQDWVRERTPFSADLDQAARIAANVEAVGRAAGDAPSPQTVALADIIRTTMTETNVSLEVAKQLIQKARDKDEAAAAQAERRAIIGLLASIGGVGSAAGGISSSSSSMPDSSPPPLIVPRVMRFGTIGEQPAGDNRSTTVPNKP